MSNPDYLLYAVHVGFWASFGHTRALLHQRKSPGAPVHPEPTASREATARFSRSLVALHAPKVRVEKQMPANLLWRRYELQRCPRDDGNLAEPSADHIE